MSRNEKKLRFYRWTGWHPVRFCCILAGSLFWLAGCDGGCDRDLRSPDPGDPVWETAEPVLENECRTAATAPENWNAAAPVRQRLTLAGRNRQYDGAPAGEQTQVRVLQAAEEAVKALLLFPQEAVFAAWGMPGTGVEFPEPGTALVQGWLVAPDETGRERRMRYCVRVRFERGIWVRAELPAITVETMGKGMP